MFICEQAGCCYCCCISSRLLSRSPRSCQRLCAGGIWCLQHGKQEGLDGLVQQGSNGHARLHKDKLCTQSRCLTSMVRMGLWMMGPSPPAMSKGMFMPDRGVRISENRMTPSGLKATHGCKDTSTWTRHRPQHAALNSSLKAAHVQLLPSYAEGCALVHGLQGCCWRCCSKSDGTPQGLHSPSALGRRGAFYTSPDRTA